MKPRNHVVLAMNKLNKSAGRHQKSTKAKRQQDKVELKKKGSAFLKDYIF